MRYIPGLLVFESICQFACSCPTKTDANHPVGLGRKDLSRVTGTEGCVPRNLTLSRPDTLVGVVRPKPYGNYENPQRVCRRSNYSDSRLDSPSIGPTEVLETNIIKPKQWEVLHYAGQAWRMCLSAAISNGRLLEVYISELSDNRVLNVALRYLPSG